MLILVNVHKDEVLTQFKDLEEARANTANWICEEHKAEDLVLYDVRAEYHVSQKVETTVYRNRPPKGKLANTRPQSLG